MKKSIILLITSCFLFSLASAQETTDHFSNKNAIKINPVAFGKANFQMSYERFFGERKASFVLAPSITLQSNNYEEKSGWEVMGQYRFYLTHLRKDQQKNFLGVYNYGFYTGLYGLYADYSEDYQGYFWDEENQVSVNEKFRKEIETVEGGALIGIQIDVTKRILIDFYVGGGIRQSALTDSYLEKYPDSDYYETYGLFDPEYKGVKPKLGLMVGFTF